MRIRLLFITTAFLFLFINIMSAQSEYWQQESDYTIAIDFDVAQDSYRGMETIRYVNHSPDTLTKLYFHLYYNAFQPGSGMDVHAQNIPDPMMELDWKIKYLTSFEIGSMTVTQILQDSKKMVFKTMGTILEAIPAIPVTPGMETVLQLSFTAKVPILCRRTGRDNDEGIEYTMAQWYPKLCVYDTYGWQATPYIGREFYSDPGDYDVQIRIDSSFILAAGAQSVSTVSIDSSAKKIWQFKAVDVIDFAWAADPDYKHDSLRTKDGIQLHFYYQEEQNKNNNWVKMQKPLQEIFPYLSQRFGKYAYDSYTIIQAGDGGMEYQQSCFITGDRSLGSLVGVSIHEIMHSWYQQTLATNENRFAWMDEGFASYAATEIKEYMKDHNILFQKDSIFQYVEQYTNYEFWAKTGFEEPMNTPANFFQTNTSYNIASYTKGELFLNQLEYLIGEENLEQGLRSYYDKWKFRHPTPEDFIHIMETESGIKLDWYLHYWINTTHTIDYSIEVDTSQQAETGIRIMNTGIIPMPIDLEVRYSDGTKTTFVIPLDIMYGQKPVSENDGFLVLQPWMWLHPQYEIWLNIEPELVESIEIDPSLRLADINREDNTWNNAKGK